MSDMKENITARQIEIIRATVSEYLLTGEPVGSQIIVNEYMKDVSTATVRKEMSFLEQIGFLRSPHVSSGRIPTDRAIQIYIDELTNFYQITLHQKEKLETFYKKAKLQLDKLLQHTAHLLSSISKNAAVVLAPIPTESIIHHIELISVLENMILMIMVSNSGSVFQKKIRIEQSVNQEDLHKVSRHVNQCLKGYEIGNLQNRDISFLTKNSSLSQELLDVAAKLLQNLIYQPPDQEVYVNGEKNLYKQLLKYFPDPSRVEFIMEKLSDKKFVKDTINHLRGIDEVTSQVGLNIDGEFISGISVLAKGYSIGGKNIGALGVIGSSMMPYDKLIPTIDYSSILLSKVLSERYEFVSSKEDSFESINHKAILNNIKLLNN